MKNRDDKKQIFNLLLAKSLGIYQMLDPKTKKCLRHHNIYRCIFILLVFYNCLVAVIACLNGLYYWSNHKIESILYFGIGLNIMYISCKMYVVLYNSEQLWDCLFITQFDFTTNAQRDRRLLDLWRKRSIRFTYMMTTLQALFACFHLAYPLIFSDTLIVMKNHDGSSSKYRSNIFNLYSVVPEQTYNTHFNVFYTIETISFAFSVFCSIAFDFNLSTLCLAITCQLEMVCTAFKSVAHDESLRTPNDSINNEINICNGYNLDVFSDLITIIIDHQRVLKKYNVFLAIFRRVILMDMFILSSSIILFSFIFIMSVIEGKFADMILMKNNLAIVLIILFFAKCYLFENLHYKKGSIIFALYSSNWTEMNMRCKNMILLIMNMNNAHQQQLIFTRTRVVNLKMFYTTMHTCFSIISVLLNCVKQ